MKRKTIKRVASLLVFAMTMSTVLTGCGKEKVTPTEGTNAEGNETADNTQEEVVGKTGKVSVMVYDRGNMPSSEGNLDDNRWTTWIRENAPVAEIEYISIPKAEAPQTMSMQFAAGEAPDVLPNYEPFLPFVQNGMVMEITDEMLDKMPNYKMLLEKYPMLRKSAEVDGEMMYFTKFSNIAPNHTIVIRKDWLDNLGMELPETPEELFEIIKAFTYNDPDGNGVDDTWGINLTTDAQRVLAHMYGFPNPQKYELNEKGELVYVWDKIESWLTYSKSLVDNKLVNPDFVTMKGDDDQADFLNGKIGIYCSGRFTNASRLSLFKTFKEAFPEATIDTFALPKTEYGQFNAYLNGGGSNVGFINAEAKDVDAALAYVDWLYEPEVSEYLFYGEDGLYNKKNEYGTYAIVDEAKNKVEFDWASDYNIIKNELLDGREEPISIHANDWYNAYLSSEDPTLQEFGDLYYKMFEIANDPDSYDPRKWLNDGLPALPSDLSLIQVTADEQVDNILKTAIVDSSKSIADAIAAAKAAWYDAGGQKVDDFYNEYYKTMGDAALLASDFNNAKSAPEMTDAAKANSKLFK